MSQISKIPVILDTDIGGDIDDTWALAMLLNSPELDVKLIVSATGDTAGRAKVAAKLLEIAGRTDIPVGLGRPEPPYPFAQSAWVADYDLDKYPGTVYQDGVKAMVDTIMGSPEPITLIAIAPLPNVGAALEREPRIAEKARFVGMHGAVRTGYDGAPQIAEEYNVKNNIPAAKRTFTAPWREIVITPLDTCGLVRLVGEKYQAVANCPDPLTRAVIENYQLWLQHCDWLQEKVDHGRSSILFDTVAVYLAFADDLLVMEEIGIRIDDAGFTREDPTAKKMKVATEWRDYGAFEDLLLKRLKAK